MQQNHHTEHSQYSRLFLGWCWVNIATGKRLWNSSSACQLARHDRLDREWLARVGAPQARVVSPGELQRDTPPVRARVDVRLDVGEKSPRALSRLRSARRSHHALVPQAGEPYDGRRRPLQKSPRPRAPGPALATRRSAKTHVRPSSYIYHWSLEGLVAGGGAGRWFRSHVVVVGRQAVAAGPSPVCCRGLLAKLVGHGETIYCICEDAQCRFSDRACRKWVAADVLKWTRARDILSRRVLPLVDVPKTRDWAVPLLSVSVSLFQETDSTSCCTCIHFDLDIIVFLLFATYRTMMWIYDYNVFYWTYAPKFRFQQWFPLKKIPRR
jgi:hypothetical protein